MRLEKPRQLSSRSPSTVGTIQSSAQMTKSQSLAQVKPSQSIQVVSSVALVDASQAPPALSLVQSIQVVSSVAVDARQAPPPPGLVVAESSPAYTQLAQPSLVKREKPRLSIEPLDETIELELPTAPTGISCTPTPLAENLKTPKRER